MTIFDYTFLYYVCLPKIRKTMTLLVWYIKNVLTPLNVNCHQLSPTFKKLTALTVNDLDNPTIRCPLNVNGLFRTALKR